MGTSADPFGCVKNTIRTRSGRYFDLLDPKPDQFTLEDIAGALSKMCRFGGQIDRFYSVAEHCYHCAALAEKDGASLAVRRAALMHDAAEAFVGDVVKPLKIMLPEYDAIERRVELVIVEKFGLEGTVDWPPVKEIDRAMLIAERRALFSADEVVWTGEKLVRQLDVKFVCWPPVLAEQAFLSVATALGLNGA